MDIKRKLGLSILLGVISLALNAQVNEFEKEFEEFTRQARKNYNDFRSKANK